MEDSGAQKALKNPPPVIWSAMMVLLRRIRSSPSPDVSAIPIGKSSKKFLFNNCCLNIFKLKLRCSWDRSNSFKLAKCSAWPKPEGENVNDAIVNSDNSQRMFVQQTKCPPLTKPANGNVRCTEVNKDGKKSRQDGVYKTNLRVSMPVFVQIGIQCFESEICPLRMC